MVHHVYALWGVGCMERNKTKWYGKVKYHLRSNKRIFQLVADIGLTCIARKNREDSYSRRIIHQVQKSIEHPDVDTVHIVAHSYGGFVTSQIINTLRSHPKKHKLYVITYGSIRLMEPHEYRGIRVRQYMNKGDLSMRCNQQTTKGVIWLKSNRFFETTRHMDYPLQETIDSIIKKLGSK
jgi:hypothetical protein